MIKYEDRWFEVNNDSELIKIYYSIHSGWNPDKGKLVASLDLKRTLDQESHRYLSFDAVCEIASHLSQINEQLGGSHDV